MIVPDKLGFLIAIHSINSDFFRIASNWIANHFSIWKMFFQYISYFNCILEKWFWRSTVINLYFNLCCIKYFHLFPNRFEFNFGGRFNQFHFFLKFALFIKIRLHFNCNVLLRLWLFLWIYRILFKDFFFLKIEIRLCFDHM